MIEKRKYNNMNGLSEIPRSIINYLLENNDTIFKLLKYDTIDALFKNITFQEKLELVSSAETGDGITDKSRIFFDIYLDDTTTEVQSQLRFFVKDLEPINEYISKVYIGIQIISHNNISMLSGNINRKTKILEEVIKSLNGAHIGYIGEILFVPRSRVNYMSINPKFSGYNLTMTVDVAGKDDR